MGDIDKRIEEARDDLDLGVTDSIYIRGVMMTPEEFWALSVPDQDVHFSTLTAAEQRDLNDALTLLVADRVNGPGSAERIIAERSAPVMTGVTYEDPYETFNEDKWWPYG